MTILETSVLVQEEYELKNLEYDNTLYIMQLLTGSEVNNVIYEPENVDTYRGVAEVCIRI